MTARRRSSSNRRSQRGITLLEILIAVLVLSIGILGLAGLQFFGLQEGQASSQRSQATLLAYEIADRIRAEHYVAAESAFVLDPSAGAPIPGKDCTSGACNASEMAAYDLHDWDSRVRSSLPLGRAAIVCVEGCALGRREYIEVIWDDRTNIPPKDCPDAGGLSCIRVDVAP